MYQNNLLPTTKQLLHQENSLISVLFLFCGQPMTESDVPIERAILESIKRNNLNLQFRRSYGMYRGRDYTFEKFPVYQLKSPIHHSEFNFCLQRRFGNTCCHVLMISTEPNHQGNYFALKKFLLNGVAKTLFDVGIFAIFGAAMPNDRPLRHRSDFRYQRTRDGVPKLVKLYEFLGASTIELNTSNVMLTREAYLTRLAASRSRFQHGAGVLDGQTGS